jgi:hypothetical protein
MGVCYIRWKIAASMGLNVNRDSLMQRRNSSSKQNISGSSLPEKESRGALWTFLHLLSLKVVV